MAGRAVLRAGGAMSVWKVVGKHKPPEQRPSWVGGWGKTGTQAKKTVYPTDKKFNTHSPELIERWSKYMDVEVYRMNEDEEWVRVEK
jgi:hypothetical protein